MLFEAPEAARPDRLFRGRRVGRFALPQVVVPAGFAGAGGVPAAPVDPRGAAHPARPRQHAVRQRRRGHRRRATWCATASSRATSSAAIRRASSGSRRPATPAATTTWSSRHGADDLPALLRRMGRGLLVTEQLGQGVNPVTGDYLARGRRLLGRRRRDRLSGRGDHHRRQSQGHVPRHRRRRQRRRPPRLAPRRVDPGRPDDGRRQIGRAAPPTPMLQPALNWLRSRNDPLRNVVNAEQWIAALPVNDVMAVQKEALDLVAAFPGVRTEIATPQVEALLKVDARLEQVIAQLTAQYTANYQKSSAIESRLWHAVFDLVKAFTTAYGLCAQGRVPQRREQALARGAAVGPGAACALQGPRREVPAVPLRALDTGAVARVPRALRVRADARLAARAAGVRGRRVLPSRRLRRARLPADTAADAPRFRQLHARPGRVGRAPARGLVAFADAGAAAGHRRQFLRRPHRQSRACAARTSLRRAGGSCSSTPARSTAASSSGCAGCPSRTTARCGPASCRCASSACC